MIFQHTIDKVLSGEKTQTRRVVKDGCFSDTVGRLRSVYHANGTLKWEVGQIYAAQPGRGKNAVGRIRITAIRQEHVQDITPEDACAEGIDQDVCFVVHPDTPESRYRAAGKIAVSRFQALWDSIQPAGRRWDDNPMVYVIEFELVK